MRSLVVAFCGLFVMATLLGCGAAAIPDPPANAKPGPPPGTSPEMIKSEKDAKKR